MELDSRFADIRQDVNHFDIWIRLSSIGNKVIISLPFQKHIHFNNFLKNGWTVKKSIRLRIVDIGYKKLIAGSDGEFTGGSEIYEKTAREKQGSRAFKRALAERDEIINIACKI